MALALLAVLPGVGGARAEGLDSVVRAPASGAAPAGAATHAAAPAAAAAWRFRIGPVFEIGRSGEGVNVLAVRPLFSRVSETNTPESITDAVWPVSSFHRRDDYFHWWALPAFGKDANVRDPLSRHTFWLLPIYCSGRTRAGEDFEALFPVGGSVRDFLGMDELQFFFFPLYLNYRKGNQETDSYLWPVYLQETGPKRERFRIFPVYGTTTTATERATFAFWPFWTRQVFDGPKQHGTSEMLFPVYGRVDTDRQHGWMALPPFFSRMEMTNGETNLRCPWPFFETGHRKDRDKESRWPLWTHTETPTGHRGTIAWPFWWEESSAAGGRREQSETLVPFYHAARSEVRAGNGGEYVADLDYVRFWPIYSREETPERTRIRVPELTLMRDGQGIERNWAPFWSWYVQQEGRGGVDHDLFWGLARWGRQCDHTTYAQLGPLVAWKRPPGGRLDWTVLGGLLGREGEGAAAQSRWFWFWTRGGMDEAGEQSR
ncbi:MAG: hypothetical protein WCI17_07810 [bacterium]